MMEKAKDKVMRTGFHLAFPKTELPIIIGKSGNTQGARTVSSPEMYEVKRSESIVRAIKFVRKSFVWYNNYIMIKLFLSQFSFVKSIICLFVAGIPFIFLLSSNFKIHLLKISPEVFYLSICFWYFIFLIFAIIFICYTIGFWKKFITIFLTIISALIAIFGIFGLIFATIYDYTYIKDCGKYDLVLSHYTGSNGKPTLYYKGKYLDNSVLITSNPRLNEITGRYVDDSNPNSDKYLNEFDANNTGLKNTQKLYLKCIS